MVDNKESLRIISPWLIIEKDGGKMASSYGFGFWPLTRNSKISSLKFLFVVDVYPKKTRLFGAQN